MKLLIKEIFYSIQGESERVGWPTVFIRLSGCPLRCHYCDTAYAFSGGKHFSVEQIIEQVQTYNTKFVTVTGGEPLAQGGCRILLDKLSQLDYQVSVETSGAFSVEGMHKNVMVVMDIKTPSSGELDKFEFENVALLKPSDQIKFVVGDRADYQWACEFARTHGLAQRCTVLFSPVYEKLSPKTLADWLLKDQHPFRLQIQLHKYLWGDEPGR